MPASEEAQIRERLRRLGRRRDTIEANEQQLASEIEEALGDAYGVISVAEASRLLGVHRTTVYRVYHPHEQRPAA